MMKKSDLFLFYMFFSLILSKLLEPSMLGLIFSILSCCSAVLAGIMMFKEYKDDKFK